jgi:hypothetical protein
MAPASPPEQQGGCLAQECRFLTFVDFPDEQRRR